MRTHLEQSSGLLRVNMHVCIDDAIKMTKDNDRCKPHLAASRAEGAENGSGGSADKIRC
jgi:hypothetical protein